MLNGLDLRALQRSAHVVYVRTQRMLTSCSEGTLLTYLSNTERERHARFPCHQTAKLYLTSHVLTRGLLAQVLGYMPHELTFTTNTWGRPELSGTAADSGVRFSVSYAPGLVACALSLHADIGVDVEYELRDVAIDSAIQRVCSVSERAALMRLAASEQRTRFFELWTLKEAYGKALGRGLTASLSSVSFDIKHPDRVQAHFAEGVRERAEDWTFVQRALPPAHRIAVALRAGRAAQIRMCELSALHVRGNSR